MRKSHGHLALLAGLLGLLVIPGCGRKPVQVVSIEPGLNFQRYTTLVLKDFQNGVGDTLPGRAVQDLPETVVIWLNECYPGAFERIQRTAQGRASELVVGGTITDYKAGNSRGWGSKLASELSFADGESGRELAKANVELVMASRRLAGATGGIETLVYQAGKLIADEIADKKGVAIKAEPASGSYEMRTGSSIQEVRAERCKRQ